MTINKLALISMASLVLLPFWQKTLVCEAQKTHRLIKIEEAYCATKLDTCDEKKIQGLGKRGLLIIDTFYASTTVVFAVFVFVVYTMVIKRRVRV